MVSHWECMGRELVYSNTICHKCYIVTLHCYDTEERVRCFPIGSASMIRTLCALEILHGMVMLTRVRGVVSYWECSRGSWREGPEAYTYQVPAHRHSVVRFRGGRCLLFLNDAMF